MNTKLSPEEKLVAELELMGIRYLSRQTTHTAKSVRPYHALFADLIRQPNSRIRTAFIAVLLAHPEVAQEIQLSIKLLNPSEQVILKILYTAAVILQKEYARSITKYQGKNWLWLPDLFSGELGLSNSLPPKEIIKTLAQKHSQHTNIYLNWEGTYRNVVDHLIHRWEIEAQWQM